MGTPTDRSHLRGVVLLVVVAMLWGTTFVVIKGAVTTLAPSVLVLARFALASVVVLPFAQNLRNRDIRLAGLELGFWLWAGYAAQVHGMTYTTASRSAFITSVSVVLVAVFAGLLGRRLGWPAWLAAGMAFTGVALLSYDGSPPNRGDAWTLATAVAYAGYVLRLEAHARRFRPVPLTVAQIWGVVPFAATWVVVDMLVAGSDVRFGAPAAWFAVAYLALVTTALTTWLQTVGQRAVAAPEAAVIYSTEPLWAALMATVVLAERLGPQGLAGAMLIVAAVLTSQWPGHGGARHGGRPGRSG